MPRNPAKTRCSHTTRSGAPCRAWAVTGSSPPACAAHAGKNVGAGAPEGNQNARAHGFYSSVLEPSELDALDAAQFSDLLHEEIRCARVALRRVLQALTRNGDLTTEEKATLASLALQATRTIARLLRDQRALSGDAADGIVGAVAQALDELGSELGLDL